MQKLPTELLIKIFAQLKSKQDLLSCSLVCQQWHLLIIPWLFKEVKLDDSMIPFFVKSILLSAKRRAMSLKMASVYEQVNSWEPIVLQACETTCKRSLDESVLYDSHGALLGAIQSLLNQVNPDISRIMDLQSLIHRLQRLESTEEDQVLQELDLPFELDLHHLGWGPFVESILIPSEGDHVHLLQYLRIFLPNLKK
jgi:hypothetical protein